MSEPVLKSVDSRVMELDYVQLLRRKIANVWLEDKHHDISSLNKVLSKVISFIMKGEEAPSKLSRTSPFSHLYKQPVYLVLNYAPYTDKDSRVIASGSRLDNLGVETRRYLDSLKYERDAAREMKESFKLLSNSPNSYVMFDEASTSTEGFRSSVGHTWYSRWCDYIANQSHEKASLSTWNYFLMHLSRDPRPIGLTWSDGCQSDQSLLSDYVYLTINKERFEDSRHQKNLYNLSRLSLKDFIQQSDIPIASDRLAHLRRLWGSCLPKETRWVSDDSLEYAIKSLCWEPMFWGGNSFISIPVIHSASAPGHTGVLSLCTKEPLGHQDLVLWRLIASTIFSSLFSLEAADRYKAETSRFVYRIGHPVKNRSSAVATHVNKSVILLNRFIKKQGAQSGTEFDTNIQELMIVLNTLDKSKKLAKRLTSFGDMANFFANYQNSPTKDDLWRSAKDKWLSKDKVYLHKLLLDIQDSEICAERGDIALSFKLESPLENFTFDPAIHVDDELYNLSYDFFNEIISELGNNALKHGIPDDSIVHVNVFIYQHSNKDYLCFENKALIPSLRKYVDKEPIEIEADGSGGEALAAHFLHALLGSSLFRQVLSDDDNSKEGSFRYLIDLSSLDSYSLA